ncbi:MAG: hypothetical protein ACKVP7_00535 [Hyphomicrobiaceae bacterium]
MICRRGIALGAAASLALPALAWGQSRKPKLPPGRDPGGVAVAIIGAGVDYTRPEITNRLARDGEGELIGWDFVDNDNRPFERADAAVPVPHHAGSEMALALLGTAPHSRLIPIRVPDQKIATLVRALALAAKTPARIAIVLTGGEPAAPWQPFSDAVGAAPSLLVIASAATLLRHRPPRDKGLPAPENLLVVGVEHASEIAVLLPIEPGLASAEASTEAKIAADNHLAVRVAAKAVERASQAKGIWPGAILKQRLFGNNRN